MNLRMKKRARWCVLCWNWTTNFLKDGKTCYACWNPTLTKAEKEAAS